MRRADEGRGPLTHGLTGEHIGPVSVAVHDIGRLWEKLVLSRHVLKNAMLPVITVIGLEFAFLIGGLVVTEQVFNINGLGKLFVSAVGYYDYTLVQGLVLLVAFIFVFTNLVVDMVYAWIDPRIRYG